MDTNSAALSKHAQKKLAKQQYKKQMKAEHHAKAHEVMLQQASRLRAQLQQDQTSAVPESALYAQLPRESACELFAALGDSAIERSVLFQRQPKPSWTSGGSPASASTDAANVAGSTDAADVGANAGMPDKASVASANARACHVLGHFLWRAAKYNEKYAPQELSLLYQLYRLGGPKCDLVIDIGAGNANLSCLIALAFDVPVVCVEMESPRPELRGEAWLPPQLLQRRAVTRVERRIQDYALPDGYERVLVLGKHLCGPGTDAGIDFVRQHRARILGCVFATCCCCKIVGGLAAAGGTGTTLFSELYFGGGGGDAGTGPACQPCEEEEQGVREGSGPESRKRPSPPPSSSSPPAADANADADAVADAATDATASAAAATDAVAAAATTMSRKEAARARDAARLLAAKELARQAGKQLCRRFLRYGDCPDGTSCRFHHCTAEELEAAEAGSVANLAADADEGLGLFRRYRAAEEPTAAAAGGGVSAALPALSEAARPAFLRRALPDVARATSWRNAVFNAKHRQAMARPS